VGFIPIDLVGERFVRETRYDNIQKGKGVFMLGFHSELDVGGNNIEMIDEKDQVGVAMRPDEKCVIQKLKPTFGFERRGL
jgi:hypothetical protein